ncbi:hypothetical protein F6Y02_05930 (plasmid) [Bacillus megaterium]|nr:hypothetical protein [Priestia megaterium]
MRSNQAMKAFSSMKMNKKFARKAEKVERKRTGFGHEVKKRRGTQKGREELFLDITVSLGFA